MLIAVDHLHLPRSAATAREPESAAQPGRTSPFLRRPSSKHVPRTLWSALLFPPQAVVFFFLSSFSFRSLRERSARCARLGEAQRLPGVCTCPRWSAGAPCKIRGETCGLTECAPRPTHNCQGELRPIFSDEKRRGLALRSGAARTRPTPALEVHLGLPIMNRQKKNYN